MAQEQKKQVRTERRSQTASPLTTAENRLVPKGYYTAAVYYVADRTTLVGVALYRVRKECVSSCGRSTFLEDQEVVMFHPFRPRYSVVRGCEIENLFALSVITSLS